MQLQRAEAKVAHQVKVDAASISGQHCGQRWYALLRILRAKPGADVNGCKLLCRVAADRPGLIRAGHARQILVVHDL